MKTKASHNKERQIVAKLQSVKGYDELKKIYSSIEDQNRVLRQDILGLKYKVDILMKRQSNTSHHTTPQDQTKTKEIQSLRKELKQNYRLMQQLKKRSETYNQERSMQQQITNQSANTNNSLKVLQLQIQENKKLINVLKNETQRLEKTMSVHEEENLRNQPKIQEYQENNGQLRKKIFSLKKLGTQKQYESTKIMNSMYSVKHRYSKNEQLFHQIQLEKISTTKQKKTTKKQSEVDMKTLQKDVQTLRTAVKKSESEYLKNEGLKLKLKDRLQTKNKQELKQSKQLQEKKFKLIQQHNKLKKMWSHYLEMQEKSKHAKQDVHEEVQVQPYLNQENLLRRDFAGILGGKIIFDDRQALKDNKKSFILGFYVYQFEHIGTSKTMLVGIRAIYDDQQANAKNHLPLPGQYLSKCKTSKYILNEGDFIKLFKIKYQAIQNRILKIQIRTNKNNKYEFGDRRSFNDLASGENVYGFDISIQEYPVCLFGSFNMIRSQWYMQSLGVQVNDL